MVEATRNEGFLDSVRRRAQEWLEDRPFLRQINRDLKEMAERTHKNWDAAPEADKADIDRRLDAYIASTEGQNADARLSSSTTNSSEPKINPSIADPEPHYAKMMEDMRPKPYTETFGLDEEGRLHRDPREGPAQVTTLHEDWGDGFGATDRTELYMVHGGLVARAESRSAGDEETTSYRETWYDRDGKLHSFNGNPAEITYSNHGIPSETYLDESRERFYDHGKDVNSIDRTYEDIVLHKPATVREAFGYDIDGDEPVASKREYPNRFATPLPSEAPEVRESRSDEITRKYAEATHSGDTVVQPTITKPSELENYRQEQLFHGKHPTDEQRAAESWLKDAGESYMAELANRSESNVDRRQMEMWAAKQEQNRAAWDVASPVTHERQQEAQANTITLKP